MLSATGCRLPVLQRVWSGGPARRGPDPCPPERTTVYRARSGAPGRSTVDAGDRPHRPAAAGRPTASSGRTWSATRATTSCTPSPPLRDPGARLRPRPLRRRRTRGTTSSSPAARCRWTPGSCCAGSPRPDCDGRGGIDARCAHDHARCPRTMSGRDRPPKSTRPAADPPRRHSSHWSLRWDGGSPEPVDGPARDCGRSSTNGGRGAGSRSGAVAWANLERAQGDRARVAGRRAAPGRRGARGPDRRIGAGEARRRIGRRRRGDPRHDFDPATCRAAHLPGVGGGQRRGADHHRRPRAVPRRLQPPGQRLHRQR